MASRKLAGIRFIVFATFVLAALTGVVHMAKLDAAVKGSSGGRTTSYEEPVTSVVFDSDSTGAQLLLRSDDFNGTGQATYTSFTSGNQSLTSEIGVNGNWRVLLTNQSVRSLWIAPNEAIDNSQPLGPPAGYYWDGVEAYSQCYDQNNNLVPFENLVNGSGNCSLGVDFVWSGTLYKLVMSPKLPAPGPATGLAKVTCNSVSNNQCVNWSIVTDLTAPHARVANLYKWTGSKKSPWAYIGQYYNSFSINASNP